MRLAVICCANGLGHARRAIKITRELVECLPIRSATLFCEEQIWKEVKSWNEFKVLAERTSVEAAYVKLPVRWYTKRDTYGDWVHNWHKAMSAWNLDSFDHVLSDNLIEPLFYTNRVTLVGSFLWHDVLLAAFPGSGEIHAYWNRCEALLRFKQPNIIANEYFATPAVRRQTSLHEVGLIHLSGTRKNGPSSQGEKKALIALGAAECGEQTIDELISVIPLLQQTGIQVCAASLAVYRKLTERYCGIELFDFASGDLGSVDLAIIRGGLGTISDCVAARVPMYYLNDPNPEICFNQRRLCELRIGMPLQGVLKDGNHLLTNGEMLRQMIASMKELRLDGEKEAAAIIAKQITNDGESRDANEEHF